MFSQLYDSSIEGPYTGMKSVCTSDEPSSHVRTQNFLSRSAALCKAQLHAQRLTRDTRLLALGGFIRFHAVLFDSLGNGDNLVVTGISLNYRTK